MKPQDVVILLKIILSQDSKWTTVNLAKDLYLSQSEISKSLQRSQMAKLYNAKQKIVYKNALFDFLLKGLRYVFPAKIGRISTGVATSISCKVLREKIITDDNYVWPCIEGNMRGESVQPLYEKVPLAAMKDPLLHEVLALIDAIRIGRVREVELAQVLLRQRIFADE
jgi:hypothetical protein